MSKFNDKKITYGDKVKVINADYCHFLKMDHIYTVEEIMYDGSVTAYALMGLPGFKYNENRFIKVEDV